MKKTNNSIENNNLIVEFKTNCDIQLKPVIGKQGESFVLPILEKENFFFDGWYTDEKFTNKYNNEIYIFSTESQELYAKFKVCQIKQGFENYSPVGAQIWSDFSINKPDSPEYNKDYVRSGSSSVFRRGNLPYTRPFTLFSEDTPSLEIGETYILQIWIKPIDLFFENSEILIRHCPSYDKCYSDQEEWAKLGYDLKDYAKIGKEKQLEFIAKCDDLSVGEWNLVTYEFVAKTPFLAICSPEYNLIAYDDCMITLKSAIGYTLYIDNSSTSKNIDKPTHNNKKVVRTDSNFDFDTIKNNYSLEYNAEMWNGEQIKLYPNGSVSFKIIYPTYAENNVIKFARNIKTQVFDRLGLVAEYKPDSVEDDSCFIEVLVGETNRSGYNEIFSEITNFREKYANDWTIKMVNNKIHIVAGSNFALEYAVDYFIDMFCSTLGTIITRDFSYFYKHKTEEKFKINGIGNMDDYNIVIPKYNLSFIVGRELEELSGVILRSTGSSVNVFTDREKKGKKEIIISGNTDRGSVANITDANSWQISVKEGDVYIEGGHNYSTAIAVKEFIKYIKNDESLNDGDVITGKYSEMIDGYDNYYKLTLADEFLCGINENIWDFREEDLTSTSKIAFDYKTYMRSQNTYVKDGKFVAYASYDSARKSFYGAGLTSADKVWLKYGLIEISAIVPSGGGYWSSFWLLGPSSSRTRIEADIFEQFSPGDAIKQTLHCLGDIPHGEANNCFKSNYMQGQNQKSWYFLPKGELFSDTYHTFAFEYDENSCRMAVDGQVLYEIDYSTNEKLASTFRQYSKIIMGIGVGSNRTDLFRPTSNDDSAEISYLTPVDLNASYWEETNKYIIDYFHLYQRPGQGLKFRNKSQKSN